MKEAEITKKPIAIICDIDNCYTDSREWIATAPINSGDKSTDRKAWDEYQTRDYLCKPNNPFIEYIVRLSQVTPILFVTSREDRKNSKADTIRHIEEFSDGKIKLGDRHKLFMRREFDYRPSNEVKKDILITEIIPNYVPILAYDDELRNIKMYAEMGIVCALYDLTTNSSKCMTKKDFEETVA